MLDRFDWVDMEFFDWLKEWEDSSWRTKVREVALFFLFLLCITAKKIRELLCR